MNNRLTSVLIVLTLVTQGFILFKMYNHGAPSNPSSLSSGKRPPSPPRVRPAPPGTKLDISQLPVRGEGNSKIVVVEFSDYECPFCSRYAKGTGKELESEYVNKGSLKLAFANNPLPIHPAARLLAVGALCGGKQGHYWEMHDRIFSEAPRSKEDLVAVAVKAGLAGKPFEQCLADDKPLIAQIEADMASAMKLDLTGTPGFAVGRIGSDGQLEVEQLIVGAQPIEVFRKAIATVASGS